MTVSLLPKPLFYIVAFLFSNKSFLLALPILIMFSACAPLAITPLMVGSVATEVATGKSPTEHAVSESTDKDCKFTRILEGKNVCEYRLKPSEIPVVDLTRRVQIIN